MISLDYESLEKLFNEFMLLFDNCITYWRGYSPSKGAAYISAAETLKTLVASLWIFDRSCMRRSSWSLVH